MKINIIADIAGRYEELMLLLKKMPASDKIILVGDLIDRGPDSKRVVEWAMSTPNVITLKGNHEDFMIDAYEHAHGEEAVYQDEVWMDNGGWATLDSYGLDIGKLPPEHMAWMKSLPLFYQEQGLFVSHAPWFQEKELGKTDSERNSLWNRRAPSYREGVYQVHGHNTYFERYVHEGIEYGICLDGSGYKQLKGMHWPSKEIFSELYIK